MYYVLYASGDDAHPVSTAVALESVIANSQLVVSKTKKEARHSWPDIISNFLDTYNNQVMISSCQTPPPS
jgi:hypothetical protein